MIQILLSQITSPLWGGDAVNAVTRCVAGFHEYAGGPALAALTALLVIFGVVLPPFRRKLGDFFLKRMQRLGKVFYPLLRFLYERLQELQLRLAYALLVLEMTYDAVERLCRSPQTGRCITLPEALRYTGSVIQGLLILLKGLYRVLEVRCFLVQLNDLLCPQQDCLCQR